MIDIDKLIDKFFASFTPKQKKVVFGRFGIGNGKRKTLQKIGNELGITRERVRQIEAYSIKKLLPYIKKDMEVFLKKSSKYLVDVGGVKKGDEFIDDIKNLFFKNSKTKHIKQKIKFIFLVVGIPLYQKENNEFYDFWYVDTKSKKNFFDLVKKVTKFFKLTSKDKILDKKIHLKEFPNFASYHFLSIPKHFKTNIFGDFGLRSWAEIEPKTIRDKSYLTLKKHGKPLHFEGIAKLINKYGIDKKSAHIQTVHNELIKDSRFVLVGRGMYGLKERGFEPGTVKDVIVRLLKKQGPLHSNEVVKLVNQQRFLKENTVLLGLQNKNHFKKLDDGRYTIREA